MHDLAAAETDDPVPCGLEAALCSGLCTRATGVTTYSVPEAAAVLSVPRSHLYQPIRGGTFSALRRGLAAGPGRCVVSARRLEALLEAVPLTCVPLVLIPDPASAADSGRGGDR